MVLPLIWGSINEMIIYSRCGGDARAGEPSASSQVVFAEMAPDPLGIVLSKRRHPGVSFCNLLYHCRLPGRTILDEEGQGARRGPDKSNRQAGGEL